MPDFFNVFTAPYNALENEFFAGSGAEARILHRSPDDRQLTVASRYPNGVSFRYGADLDYMESFYVAQGHGTRTLPDGTVIEMNVGDLILVEPGIDIDYVYDPGFLDVAFFWSDRPLPGYITGDATD